MAKRHSTGYLRQTFTYNGKRHTVYGKTKSELFEKEKLKRQQLKDGEAAVYNPTLRQYYETFTEIRRSEISGNTLRGQICLFNNAAAVRMPDGGAFGDMRIKDITRRHIEIARQTYAETHSTMNTNDCFSHLNHVFSTAAKEDTILKNPCAGLKQLKREIPTVRDGIHRALTIEETETFFKTAAARNSYYYNVFDMLIHTGMRIGELAALYPTDIDKKNGFIHIRRTVTRTEAGLYVIGQNAKTSSGARDIPLTEKLVRILRAQDDLNRALFGFSRDGLLFRSAENDILKEYAVSREIARVCKEAAIERFTCHAFRNTFATRFIEQRPQDYKILSELLGHKDIAITLNLYTHVMTENKVVAMKELQIKTG